jgi:hypothetical protein
MRNLGALMLLALLFVHPAAGSSDWCYMVGDNLYASADEGTITIHHDAAFYNCCPDSITYAWSQDGFRFTVVETEVMPQCLCYCCFDLTTARSNVPPGSYEIDFRWEKLGRPMQRTLYVYVPDAGQSGESGPGPRTMSNCIPSPPVSGASNLPAAPGQLTLRVDPNPVGERAVIAFETPSQGRATLSVYAGSGVSVRTVLDQDVAGGAHAAIWDGRDDAGRRLPQGVYYLALRVSGHVANRSVIVLY